MRDATLAAGATPGSAPIVIIGASVAGLTTAEALRAQGETAPITLLGSENHLPYSRPSVSKQVLLGSWTPEQAAITDPERLEALDIRFLPGVCAERLDVDAHAVTVSGQELTYRTLVIATGARARWLPQIPNARTMRTMDDAQQLRAAWTERDRVVVVGAGLLGCEIAAAARHEGLMVTLVARGPAIRLGDAGVLLDAPLRGLLRQHGVEIRSSCPVVGASVENGRTSVELSDGSIQADVVVATSGSEPVVEWLHGSGLALDDGVLCDEAGRAAADVFAVGDVARWFDPATGVYRRCAHQLTAIEHAHAVADRITTGTVTPIGPSFFWTDLFGTRVQVVGDFPQGTTLRMQAGSTEAGQFVAVGARGGVVTGVVGWNMPREFRRARRLLPAPAAAHEKTLSPSSTRVSAYGGVA